MQNTLFHHFYWRNIRKDVSRTVRISRSCAKTHGLLHWNQKTLELLQPNGPLELGRMDIQNGYPRSLSKSETSIRFVSVITDRYNKLSKTTPQPSIVHTSRRMTSLTFGIHIGNPEFPAYR